MATSDYLPVDESGLPDWITTINIENPDELNSIPNGSVLLIDDAAEYMSNLSYHSATAQLIRTFKNVAAHKGLLIIATVQQIKDLLKTLRRPQIIYIKMPNKIYVDDEATTYKKLILAAWAKFNQIPPQERPAYVMMANMMTGEITWTRFEKPAWLTRRMLLNKGIAGRGYYNPNQKQLPSGNQDYRRDSYDQRNDRGYDPFR